MQQVEDHLFDTDGIAKHFDLVIDLCTQLHLLAAHARRQQLQRLLQYVTQAQALTEAGWGFAGEGLEVAGQRGHALQQAIDTLQAITYGFRAAAVEQQTQAAELHLQGGQRLVDLMRQGRRHLPQGRHLGGMHQAILGLAQFGSA